MKVFFCLKYFLPEQVAGTEIYVAALAAGLQQKGVEVAIIKPSYKSDVISTYEYRGLRVIEYPEIKESNADLQTGKKFPPGIKIFEQILKEESPDIIHFHEISGSNGITIQHVRTASALGIRIFLTFHLTRYVCKRSSLMFKGITPCDGVIKVTKCSVCLLNEKKIGGPIAVAATFAGDIMNTLSLPVPQNGAGKILQYPAYIRKHKAELLEMIGLSEKTIALNNWFRNMLVENDAPSDKMTVIENSLPLSDLSKVNTTKTITGNIRIIFLGRICRLKGVRQLIEAFKAIKNTNATLDIFGNVTEPDYYEECLALSSAHPNIRWKGVIEPASVITVISSYDLLVFPSQVEEMSPFTILESFAAKVPVLASGLRACRDRITDGTNGWLFSLQENGALLRKLQELLHEPGKIYRAAENIGHVNSFDEVVSSHHNIYFDKQLSYN